MELFKTFKEKFLRGLVRLEPVPVATVKMSVLASIVIERETSDLIIKIVLEDGTDFMFQRVAAPKQGDTITLKDIQIVTDIILT